MMKIRISRKFLSKVGFVLMFVFSFLMFYLVEVYGDDNSLSTFSNVVLSITVLIGMFCSILVILCMFGGLMFLVGMFLEWVRKIIKKFIEVV